MKPELRISFNVITGAFFLLALGAVLTLALFRFPFGGTGGVPAMEPYQIARPALLYYDGTIYQCGSQIGPDLPEDCAYLGVVESTVANDTLPGEDLQSNIPCAGAEVYQRDGGLVLMYGGVCWSYFIQT